MNSSAWQLIVIPVLLVGHCLEAVDTVLLGIVDTVLLGIERSIGEIA